MICLDCTLRDGGYQNQWQYDLQLANKYLEVMERSKIDAVEVGFRSPSEKNIGLFSNVTDSFIIKNLYNADIKYFGVMINTSEMTSSIISRIFSHESLSPINFVRVATHFKNIDAAESICKDLKHLGYFVTIQMMQVAGKSYEEIANTAKRIEEWHIVDVLYLADSMGGMDHDAINYAFSAIKEEWNGLTGFHAHNNKGQALNNTLEAVDLGVDFVDSTILGMGRGAGNTETEYLLKELNKRGFGEYKLKEIYRLCLNEFTKFKDQYEWGPSLLYYLAAENNIHPTYIQKVLSYNLNPDKLLDIIFKLSDIKSNSFNEKLLKKIINEDVII